MRRTPSLRSVNRELLDGFGPLMIMPMKDAANRAY